MWSFAVLVQKLRLLQELLMLFVVLLELVHGLIIYLFQLFLIFLINFILDFFPGQFFIWVFEFNWRLHDLWRRSVDRSGGAFSWSWLSLKLGS